MKRRSVVRAAGGGALAGLAGCFSREENGEDNETADVDDQDDPEPEEPDLEGTLRVATTESVVVGERAVGERLREAFEEEFDDAELQWTVPETGLDHYVQRTHLGAEIDADVYLGLTPATLARVDTRLEGRDLFRELNDERITAADRIRDSVEFGDPNGRVLPAGVRYSCLLYDEDELEAPETLEELTDSTYEESLLVPNPGQSESGLAFLLWTIDAFGADDALEYWQQLRDNGVEITDGWAASAEAYAAAERPLSVAYSTDPVLAEGDEWEADRYQIAFPDGEGYETPIGMAIFEEPEELDLAYDFLNFALSSEVQAELAESHLQFPAVSEAFVDLSEDFEEHTEHPSETVSIGYDRLQSDLEEWLDDWGNVFTD